MTPTDPDAPSRELEVPDEAHDAGTRAASCYMDTEDAIDVTSDVLRAGAPIVVAAELRRMAAGLDDRAEEIADDNNLPVTKRSYASGMFEAASRLRERADELTDGAA